MPQPLLYYISQNMNSRFRLFNGTIPSQITTSSIFQFQQFTVQLQMSLPCVLSCILCVTFIDKRSLDQYRFVVYIDNKMTTLYLFTAELIPDMVLLYLFWTGNCCLLFILMIGSMFFWGYIVYVVQNGTKCFVDTHTHIFRSEERRVGKEC